MAIKIKYLNKYSLTDISLAVFLFVIVPNNIYISGIMHRINVEMKKYDVSITDNFKKNYKRIILGIIFLLSLTRAEKIVKTIFDLRGLASIHTMKIFNKKIF